MNNWLSSIVNIILSLSAAAIVGGFILRGQYAVAALIIGIGIVGYLAFQVLIYVNNQSLEQRHINTTLASLMAQQQTFYFNRIMYLQDRLQGVEPGMAHGLNDMPERPLEPEPMVGFIDTPAVDGVKVRRFE